MNCRNLKHNVLCLSLLAALAAPVAANAASAMENRVYQLERVTTAQGEVISRLQQQLIDNQRDIDMMRGQLEESQYQMQQILERQRTLSQQLDELDGGQSTSGAAKNQQPANVDKTPQSQATPAQPSNGAASEDQDYQRAIDYVLKDKDNEKGLAAFQAFVAKYPKSKQAPNAYYWLGQLNYTKGQYDEASRNFAIVVRDHAKSGKAADSLLKIGMVMEAKKQPDNAKKVYQQVISVYPNTATANQAKQRLNALK